MKFILIILALSLSARATELSTEEMVSIVGPFPSYGSFEERTEFQLLLTIQKRRTEKDCKLAKEQEHIDFEDFFAKPRGPLSLAELREQLPISVEVREIYRHHNRRLKDYFQRTRPSARNALINPCVKPNSSFAYPSGHTTIAFFWANVLAKIYPDKEAQLLERAGEIAFNRIISGVHHPSDIVAGQKLGSALAKSYLKVPESKRD